MYVLPSVKCCKILQCLASGTCSAQTKEEKLTTIIFISLGVQMQKLNEQKRNKTKKNASMENTSLCVQEVLSVSGHSLALIYRTLSFFSPHFLFLCISLGWSHVDGVT